MASTDPPPHCLGHQKYFEHLSEPLDGLELEFDLGRAFEEEAVGEIVRDPKSGSTAAAEPTLILHVSYKHPKLGDGTLRYALLRGDWESPVETGAKDRALLINRARDWIRLDLYAVQAGHPPKRKNPLILRDGMASIRVLLERGGAPVSEEALDELRGYLRDGLPRSDVRIGSWREARVLEESAHAPYLYAFISEVAAGLTVAGVVALVNAAVKRWRKKESSPPRRVSRVEVQLYEKGQPRIIWREEVEEGDSS